MKPTLPPKISRNGAALVSKHLILERWENRLCNNITQICHAIHAARKTGSRLELPAHPGMIATRNFDFSAGQALSETLRDPFFMLRPERIGIKAVSWENRRRTLIQDVKPLLPATLFPERADDGLVLYIRSGDVFVSTQRIHGRYVQPPLSFYTYIINSRAWSGIRIVAEDTYNPVIPALLAKFPQIRFSPGSLEEDIRALLAAKHVAIGYGSFGITWALMSAHIRTLYTPHLIEHTVFGRIWPGDLSDIDVHTFRFRRYLHRGWRADPEQLALMLAHQERDMIVMRVAAAHPTRA